VSKFVPAGIQNVTSEVKSTYTSEHVEMDSKRWSIGNRGRVPNERRVVEGVNFCSILL
jgi:hypothetical protein